jgi:hypothetical protein
MYRFGPLCCPPGPPNVCAQCMCSMASTYRNKFVVTKLDYNTLCDCFKNLHTLGGWAKFWLKLTFFYFFGDRVNSNCGKRHTKNHRPRCPPSAVDEEREATDCGVTPPVADASAAAAAPARGDESIGSGHSHHCTSGTTQQTAFDRNSVCHRNCGRDCHHDRDCHRLAKDMKAHRYDDLAATPMLQSE